MAQLQTYRPSCRLHKMCVPVEEELNYLGWYEEPHSKGYVCRVHKQLDEIHVDYGKPAHSRGSNVWGDTFGNVSSLPEGFSRWWVQEEDIPLMPEELVQGWRTPEWAVDSG